MATALALLTRAVDVALSPFQGMHPLIGLSVVSLLTAIVVLFVVRWTTDRHRIVAAKRQMEADVLEARLYFRDPRAVALAMARLAGHNLAYLRLSLAPMLVLILPFALVITQLEFHYAYGGLQSGRPAVVVARVTDQIAGQGRPDIVLTAPAGIWIETPAVWVPSLREAAWRIVGERDGLYEIVVKAGQSAFTKSVRVSDAVVRRSPRRAGSGFLDQLGYPSEPPLPGGSPVESIEVRYPLRGIPILGFEVPWLAVYLGLSLVFALILRRPLGVVF